MSATVSRYASGRAGTLRYQRRKITNAIMLVLTGVAAFSAIIPLAGLQRLLRTAAPMAGRPSTVELVAR